MKPEWRTSTVYQLCQTVRQSWDYSLLPILADALTDAGCDDESMLTALRGRPDAIDAQRLVAVVYSEESAAAVRRVEYFAEGLGPDGYDGEGPRPDYRFVMDAARQWVEHGEYTTQTGAEDWRDTGVGDEFWDDYAIITGGEPDWNNKGRPDWFRGDTRGSFFSCSC